MTFCWEDSQLTVRLRFWSGFCGLFILQPWLKDPNIMCQLSCAMRTHMKSTWEHNPLLFTITAAFRSINSLKGKTFWITIFFKNTSHLWILFASNTGNIHIMSANFQFGFEAWNSKYMIQVSCWAFYQDSKRSDPDTVAQTSLIAARSQFSSCRGVCAHIPEIFHGTQMLQDKIKPLNYDVFQEVQGETSQSQLWSNSSLLESFTKRSFVKKDKEDDNWWI